MKPAHQPREIHKIGNNTLVIYQWGSLSETSSPKVWKMSSFLIQVVKKIWTVSGVDNCRYWNNDIDIFVGAREKNDIFQITSFSGNSYDLDLDTGQVRFAEFHK